MSKEMGISKAIVVVLGVSALLAAIAGTALTQGRQSILTPSPDRAVPGAAIRVDVTPALDSRRAEDLKLILRPSRAQRSDSDVELQIFEYHGDWLRARIPQSARPESGAMRLLLLDRIGEVLATSGNQFFRVIAEGPPTPEKVSPAPGVPDPRGKREEAREKVQMSTPGVRAQAKRLPTQIADYVVIADEAIVLEDHERRVRGDSPTIRLSFTLPNDAILNDRAVLTYMMNPTGEHPSNPRTARVLVNGHLLEEYEFREGTNRGMWIAFRGYNRILRHGENSVEFRCFVGGEKITIDDVVLWYHREIEW